jgi:hypothetical protein
VQGWASSLTFDILMNASMGQLTPPAGAVATLKPASAHFFRYPMDQFRLPLTTALLYTSNAYSLSSPAGHRDRAGLFAVLLIILNIGGHSLPRVPARCLLRVADWHSGNVYSPSTRTPSMAEPRVTLDDAVILVRCTTRSLFKSVEFALPEVKKCFDPGAKLPRKTRSRAAAALLILKEIRSPLEEVNCAIQYLESAIKREDDSEPKQTDIGLKIVRD